MLAQESGKIEHEALLFLVESLPLSKTTVTEAAAFGMACGPWKPMERVR